MGAAEVARTRGPRREGEGGTLRFCADDGRGGGECAPGRAAGNG